MADKPYIFVAGGTASRRSRRRSSTCCTTARIAHRPLLGRALTQGPLPARPADRRGSRAHPNFTYIPVLSDALPEDAWQGRRGSSTRRCSTTSPTFRLPDVRLRRAGDDRRARKTFVEERGLPEDEFYCDAFTPSVDPKK
jgi:CDP-4-dehydro-6-deoxyglucose reductase